VRRDAAIRVQFRDTETRGERKSRTHIPPALAALGGPDPSCIQSRCQDKGVRVQREYGIKNAGEREIETKSERENYRERKRGREREQSAAPTYFARWCSFSP